MRTDVEEAKIQHEATLASLKRKQGDAVAEMSEQMDTLKMMKTKVTRDCGMIKSEIGDLEKAIDEVARSKVGCKTLQQIINTDFKASAEKASKGLELSLRDLNKKIEEQNLKLSDFEASKRRISLENSELLSQLQQQNAAASLLAQAKSALVANLDEQRALVDEVIKDNE